jgi:hypothetical protein
MSFVKVTSSDHIQGDPKAPVELVEYGDYHLKKNSAHSQLLKKWNTTLKPEIKPGYKEPHLSLLTESSLMETGIIRLSWII